jgi:hypothetical protein
MFNLIAFAANLTNVTSQLTSRSPSVSLLYSTVESFLFPFLLVFAIVYGILQRSQIFNGKSDIDAIIAFVLGIIFATTNYTLNLTFLILPIVGIIAVVIFLLLVLGSMVYGNTSDLLKAKGARKIIVLIAFVVSIGLVIWIFLSANLGFAGVSSAAVSNGLQTYAPYIVLLVFLIGVGYYLSK